MYHINVKILFYQISYWVILWIQIGAKSFQPNYKSILKKVIIKFLFLIIKFLLWKIWWYEFCKLFYKLLLCLLFYFLKIHYFINVIILHCNWKLLAALHIVIYTFSWILKYDSYIILKIHIHQLEFKFQIFKFDNIFDFYFY